MFRQASAFLLSRLPPSRHLCHKVENLPKKLLKDAKIIQTEGGRCIAEWTVRPEHSNPIGTLHAGITATLVDELSSVGLVTLIPGQKDGPSVCMALNYI